MTLLNVSGIISELNTVLASLNLATEDEQRLAVLLKTARNLGEDPSTIIAEIKTRVESIDDTALLEKFAVLIAALSSSTDDRIVTIATVDELPDASTFPLGSIFFVDEIGVPVLSVTNKWIGLDGRVLRDDTLLVDYMAWGFNSTGQLGDGTATSTSSPVTVIGGITNWSQLSAGNTHSSGITATGIAYAWGNNNNGRLGDGTTISRRSPVTVIGGITNWSSLSAGNAHSLGVTATGIAYAWGFNTLGRLGDGTTIDRSSPVTVIGGITNWSSLSAGGYHSLGVTATGIAYAWGFNSNGRLGDGTATSTSSPVTVIGGITNWSQVDAGSAHSLGVTATGIAYAWGSNSNGRLGDGTTTDRSSPVTVIGGITNWSSLSAGGSHSLGVTATGIAYAWGSNGNGRLGDGTTIDRSSPVTIIGGITNWSSLSTGGSHSLGVTATGIAYAWGRNSSGRLGDGTTTDRSSPVTVIGGITSWSSLSAGYAHCLGAKIRN